MGMGLSKHLCWGPALRKVTAASGEQWVESRSENGSRSNRSGGNGQCPHTRTRQAASGLERESAARAKLAGGRPQKEAIATAK